MSKCIAAHFSGENATYANLAASSLRAHAQGIQGISLLRRPGPAPASSLLAGGLSAAITAVSPVSPVTRRPGDAVLRVLCEDGAENELASRLYSWGARMVTVTAAPGAGRSL